MSNARQIFETELEHQVHVWSMALDHRLPSEDEVQRVLSPSENARAVHMNHLDSRRRFRVSHFALRQILARYMPCDPDKLQIDSRPFMKPRMLDERFAHLKFSLSHSADVALCAVTTNSEIGIDVEKIRNVRDFQELSERFLSAREAAYLRACVPEKRLELFFQIWTAKEAYLKALGVGLSGELKNFDIVIDNNKLRLSLPNLNHSTSPAWLITSVDVDKGYMGSLAVQKPIAQISYFKWEHHA